MPRDNRLFTLLLSLAVCLHTIKLHVCMIWLTMVLQQPAIARRTFAIELLRRSDQIQSYRRRARSKTVLLPRFCVSDSPTVFTRSNQTCIPPKVPGAKVATAGGCSGLRARKPNAMSTRSAVAAADDFDGHFSKHLALDDNNGMSGTSERNATISGSSLSSVLTFTSSDNAIDSYQPPIQISDDQEQATLVGLGSQPTPPISPMGIAKHPYEQCNDVREPTPRQRGKEQTMIEKPPTIDCLPTPPLSELGPVRFEISSAHGTRKAHFPFSDSDISVPDDATEGAQEIDCVTPKHISISSTEGIDGPFEHRAQKRWSAYSMDSISTTIRRTPVILRSPSKSNGGLLEFKAKAADPQDRMLRCKYRRLLSLNLPIRPSSSRHEADSPTSVQPSAISTPTPWFGHEETDATAQINSELQYKQRHIFVGTASLHAFLDELETCAPDTTTKSAVLKAFTSLAHKEQLMARQYSLSSEDWSLVARITTDMSEFDYITLARVQLGSVSLQRFVDSIPFNILEEAPLTTVVEAFKIASHIDTMENQNTSSKARAFRDLLMSRISALD